MKVKSRGTCLHTEFYRYCASNFLNQIILRFGAYFQRYFNLYNCFLILKHLVAKEVFQYEVY
jgi:hypothetical protein